MEREDREKKNKKRKKNKMKKRVKFLFPLEKEMFYNLRKIRF